MPELGFTVLGVKPSSHGIAPLIGFELRVENAPADERIQAVALHVQIQLECPKRNYTAAKKARLTEFFGKPERWGQTLRTRLWAHVDATVPPFSGSTTVDLTVPCTFDLNIASVKYFHALDDGTVPLLFLFSGTVFYQSDGRLAISRVAWDKECPFRMPVAVWREAIDYHYPNSAWLTLDRDVFERLNAFRRGLPAPTWENAVERLLAFQPAPEAPEEVAVK